MRIAALLLLIGCGSPLGPCPPMQGAEDDVAEACTWMPAAWHDVNVEWEMLGFPTDGLAEFPTLRWVGLDELDIGCDSATAAGCHREGVVTVFRGGTLQDRQQWAYHELRHWQGWKAGVGSDRAHKDLKRWRGWR